MKRPDYLHELQSRCLKHFPTSEPATLRYSEMSAMAMGWNEPEPIAESTQKIRVVIGGDV